MAKDGSDNLRANTNARQFGLKDPRSAGFAGRADPKEIADLHPVDHGRLVRISLAEPIYATQDYVQPEKVQRFVDNPRSGGRNRPHLVQANGKTYAWDGHHRLGGAWKKGQKTMLVRVSRPVADGG